jgi:hypothetical protein
MGTRKEFTSFLCSARGFLCVVTAASLAAFAACSGSAVTLTKQESAMAAPQAISGPETAGGKITWKVNSGQLPLETGLDQMRAVLRDASNLDSSETADAAVPPAHAEQDSVQSLADAVMHLQKGDLVPNLVRILGIEAFGSKVVDPSSVDALFAVLIDAERARAAHPTENLLAIPHLDSFLIRFYLIQQMRLQDERGFAQFGENAKIYFSRRIKTQLEEGAEGTRSLRAYRILNEYAGLGDLSALLSPSLLDAWLFDTLRPVIEVANYQGTGSVQGPRIDGARRIMKRFIGLWAADPTGRSTLSLRQIENAIENTAWLIRYARKQVVSRESTDKLMMIETALHGLLDDTFGIFDKSPNRFSFKEEAEARLGLLFALHDSTFYKLARPFQEYLVSVSCDSSGKCALPDFLSLLRLRPLHPITRTYLDRSRLSIENQPHPETASELKDGFRSFTAGYLSSISNFTGADGTSSSPQSDPAEGRFRRYLNLYYQIETKKLFAQAVNYLPRSAELSQTALHELYGSMVRDLEEAMKNRFQSENGLGMSSFRSISLADLERELNAHRTPGQMELTLLDAESNLELKPNIYRFPEDFILHLQNSGVKTLRFHPLAMIQVMHPETGGHDLTIVGKDLVIENAWIDTSSPEVGRSQHNTAPVLDPSTLGGRRVDPVKRVCRLFERNGDHRDRRDLGGDGKADVCIFSLEQAGRCVGDHLDREFCDDIFKNIYNSADPIFTNVQSDGFASYSSGYRSDEWKLCDEFMDLGPQSTPQAPSEPPFDPMLNALPAGKITVEGATFKGFTLLAAAGGNGVQGRHGSDSPRCVSGVYEDPINDDPYVFENGSNADESDYGSHDHTGPGSEGARLAWWNAWNRGTVRKLNPQFDVASGRGGKGGNASSGGDIHLSSPLLSGLILNSAGLPGPGGEPGACAPPIRPLSEMNRRLHATRINPCPIPMRWNNPDIQATTPASISGEAGHDGEIQGALK